MELWENEVYRFRTIGQLKVGQDELSVFHLVLPSYRCVFSSLCFQAISQYLPRGDLRLKPAIYEMILYEFLKTDYEVQLTKSLSSHKKRKNNSLCHFL